MIINAVVLPYGTGRDENVPGDEQHWMSQSLHVGVGLSAVGGWKLTMTKWVTFIFAVIGAFVACGVGGIVIAWILGSWEIPIAGFCAAFGTVAIAFVSAPSHRTLATFAVFFVGAVLAWFMVEPSWYPQAYADNAYQPTHMPFIVTVSGGLVSLAIALLSFKKRWRST